MASNPITVWDLPTRLFHWALVILIALQYASGEFDLLPMAWHYWMGYATLALIVFRVLWGFFGSPTSRFAEFVRGPVTVARYAIASAHGREQEVVGHNPLGGWSVLLMLACVAVQSISGLFSSDDLTESGPFAARVSDEAVKWMTRVHNVNRYVLLILIVLHVTAVMLHWAMRRENLVAPMLHGRKRVDGVSATRVVPAWRAVVLLLLSTLAVAALIVWGSSTA
ncbi:MAG TPA: cytochrome b/b6 domain-containing protein [Rhodanobacteraceae bacterium]|jgi:cytochrome b|nr:cytochrome b/b6 domain-containing protein [Rhodanobacteraceae bacterium]